MGAHLAIAVSIGSIPIPPPLPEYTNTVPQRKRSTPQSPTISLQLGPECQADIAEMFVQFEKARMLRSLDVVIEKIAHIPETKPKSFSIAKGHNHKVSPYSKRNC